MDYKRVMVFGAHPDDELGMGPAMARMASEGIEVTVVVFTDGCEGYPAPELKDTIVELRARESAAAQEVLGVHKYINLAAPDMGLVNSKEMLKKVIKIIREVKPQAIFTQGERDRHRDHIATNQLSVEAFWHAGQPVSTHLGAPWKTPHLFYYKNTDLSGPVVQYDVTEFAHKRFEAAATQESQHVLFGRTRDSFLQEAGRIKAKPPHTVVRFIIHPWTVLDEFPALPRSSTAGGEL